MGTSALLSRSPDACGKADATLVSSCDTWIFDCIASSSTAYDQKEFAIVILQQRSGAAATWLLL
jgi:hypothetical protein